MVPFDFHFRYRVHGKKRESGQKLMYKGSVLMWAILGLYILTVYGFRDFGDGVPHFF